MREIEIGLSFAKKHNKITFDLIKFQTKFVKSASRHKL